MSGLVRGRKPMQLSIDDGAFARSRSQFDHIIAFLDGAEAVLQLCVAEGTGPVAVKEGDEVIEL